jgi:hypothetical protein
VRCGEHTAAATIAAAEEVRDFCYFKNSLTPAVFFAFFFFVLFFFCRLIPPPPTSPRALSRRRVRSASPKSSSSRQSPPARIVLLCPFILNSLTSGSVKSSYAAPATKLTPKGASLQQLDRLRNREIGSIGRTPPSPNFFTH